MAQPVVCGFVLGQPVFDIFEVRAHVKKIVICRPRPSGFQKYENIFTGFFLPVYIFDRRQGENGVVKKYGV